MRRMMGRGRAAVLLAVTFIAGSLPAWARFQPVTCKNAFTEQEEITEGRKITAQVFQQMPVLPDSSPVSQYVRQLGAKLVTYAPGYKWPYDFHVVASEEINAFALPGGSIFVNLGTVRAAETEAQLAGVMAHEISHVVMRHSTCNLTKLQKKSVWYGLGSLAAAVTLGNGAIGQLGQSAIGGLQGLDFLHMSRDDEKQADLLGTGILYDAGYDPRGMPQFFETIQAKYGEGGAQMLSDHPNPGNRTQYVSAEIAKLPPRQNPKVTSPEFNRIREIAMKERVYNAKEVQAGAWRQTGHYAAVAGGPAQVIPVPGAVARLNRSAMGLNDSLQTFQGRGFVVGYPSSWQKGSGQSGTVAFAPQNGAGRAGIGYGVVIDGARWRGGVKDANSLADATAALTKQLSENNGLRSVSQVTSVSLNGQPANSVELSGKSPVFDGGSELSERDWLVTVARPDGDLNYVIFIAPEPDFEAMRPVFAAMLHSFQVR